MWSAREAKPSGATTHVRGTVLEWSAREAKPSGVTASTTS